jgi:predicted nucleotidyltransferase
MIQQALSEKLKLNVDLVSEKSLKNQKLIAAIQNDLITIFDEEERFNIS